MRQHNTLIFLSYIAHLVMLSVLLGLTGCKKQTIDEPSVSPGSLNQVTTYISYKGSGTYKDGPLAEAKFYGMAGIAFDANDNLFIADAYNNRIRKVTPDGLVSTFAGSGSSGLLDGQSTDAAFYLPITMIFDQAGSMYVTQNGAIRKITPDGYVSTLVGVKPEQINSVKYDSVGLVNSEGLVFDENKNLYVTSHSGIYNRITKITPQNKVSVFIGEPFSGHTGPVPTVDIEAPNGIAYDAVHKTFYVTDGGYGIYKINSTGIGTCYAGCQCLNYHVDGPVSSARIQQPHAATLDKAGNLYFCDLQYIRKITPNGIISTVAGTGEVGNADGPGDKASFNAPSYLAFDSKGNLFVSDVNGIRKIVLKQSQ